MKLNIKEWNTLSFWKWDVKDEVLCGICRNSYDGTCPDCSIPGDACPLIVGECTHCFHMHCLLKWIQSKQTCPMDRKPWTTAS
jgi:anaphase-promoting complex subunit 11